MSRRLVVLGVRCGIWGCLWLRLGFGLELLLVCGVAAEENVALLPNVVKSKSSSVGSSVYTLPSGDVSKLFDGNSGSCVSREADGDKPVTVGLEFWENVEVLGVTVRLLSDTTNRKRASTMRVVTSLTGVDGVFGEQYGANGYSHTTVCCLFNGGRSCSYFEGKSAWAIASAPPVRTARFVSLYSPVDDKLNCGSSVFDSNAIWGNNNGIYACEVEVTAKTLPASYFWDEDGDTSVGTLCPAGHYCPGETFFKSAKKIPCPAGTKRSSTGASSLSQCEACGDGELCGEGTAVPVACDSDPSKFCQQGIQYSVQFGYYSTPTSGPRVDEAICPKGHWCVGGVKTACEAGTFQSSTRGASSSCTGPCTGGYLCLEGSIDSVGRLSPADEPNLCDSVGFFCPPGTPAMVQATPGYFVSDAFGESTWTGALQQRKCRVGHYCEDGVAYECPAGYFGDSEALQTSTCSGKCPAGYLCPKGTSDYTLATCPVGHYCPTAGSTEPTQCPAGRFRAAPTVPTTAPVDSLANCTLCPPNTANPNPGQSVAAACVPCPEGSLTQAGSKGCVPNLVSILATDPVPVAAGLSEGDELVLEFSAGAASGIAEAITANNLYSHVEFSARIGAVLSVRWRNSNKELIIRVETLSNAEFQVDYTATRVGSLAVSTLPNAFVDSFTKSTVSPNKTMVVEGTWGDASQPMVLAAFALDRSSGEGASSGGGPSSFSLASPTTAHILPSPKEGDEIAILFDNVVGKAAVPVGDTTALNNLLNLTFPIATQWTGSWNAGGDTLTARITSPLPSSSLSITNLARLQPGRLGFTMRDDVVQVQSADLSSAASNDSAIVGGTWGLVPAGTPVVESQSPCSLIVRWQLPDAAALWRLGVRVESVAVRWCTRWSAAHEDSTPHDTTPTNLLAADSKCHEAQVDVEATNSLVLLSTQHVAIGARGYTPACLGETTADAAVVAAGVDLSAMERAVDVSVALQYKVIYTHPTTQEEIVMLQRTGAFLPAEWAESDSGLSGDVGGGVLLTEDGEVDRGGEKGDCNCRVMLRSEAFAKDGFSSNRQHSSIGRHSRLLTEEDIVNRFPQLGQHCIPMADGTPVATDGSGAGMLSCICEAVSGVEMDIAADSGVIGASEPIEATKTFVPKDACLPAAFAPLTPSLSLLGPRLPVELDTVGEQVVWLGGHGLGRPIPKLSTSTSAISQGDLIPLAASDLAAAIEARDESIRTSEYAFLDGALNTFTSNSDPVSEFAVARAPHGDFLEPDNSVTSATPRPNPAPRNDSMDPLPSAALSRYLAGKMAWDAGLSSPMHRAVISSPLYSFPLLDCSPDESYPNQRVVCTTSSGVGADLEVVLWIGGFPIVFDALRAGYSNPPDTPMCDADARACMHYLKPSISEITGNASLAARTEGGEIVLIRGRMFGAPEDAPNLEALYTPTAAPWRVYRSPSCSYAEDHVAIYCETAPGAGNLLTWQIEVGGQQSGAQTTSYALPTVSTVRTYTPPWLTDPIPGSASENDSVTLFASFAGTPDALTSPQTITSPPYPLPSSLSTLSTLGGQWIEIEGDDLGPDISFITLVEMTRQAQTFRVLHRSNGSMATATTGPQGSLDSEVDGGGSAEELAGCVMADPHTRILCRTQDGYGEELDVRVTVLGQQGLSTAGFISFAPPVLHKMEVLIGDEVNTKFLIPTEGLRPYGGEARLQCSNLPSVTSAITLTYGGSIVSTFTLDFQAQTINFVPPTVNTEAGRGVTTLVDGTRQVIVRLSVGDRSSALTITLARPELSSFDADSVLRNMTAAALDSSVELRDRLIEVKGKSFGSERSKVSVTIGGTVCRVLSEADLALHLSTFAVLDPWDAHIRSFCWSSMDRGTVDLSAASIAAASSGKVFDISLIKVPPSPTDVVYLSSSEPAVGLNRKGGDILAVSGTGLDSAGGTEIFLVHLNTSHPDYVAGSILETAARAVTIGASSLSPTIDAVNRLSLSSGELISAAESRALAIWERSNGLLEVVLPCEVLIRPKESLVDEGLAEDPCPTGFDDGAAGRNGAGEGLCAISTLALCKTSDGVGSGWITTVVTSAAVGAIDAPVSYESIEISSVTPRRGPTSGGYKMHITGTGFGDTQRLPKLVRPAWGVKQFVTIGGSKCMAMSDDEWSAGSINCTVPAGTAQNPTFILGATAAMSTATPTGAIVSAQSSFSYLPPVVDRVSLEHFPFPTDGITQESRREALEAAESALAASNDPYSRLDGGALYLYNTAGGEALTLYGRDFGTHPQVRLEKPDGTEVTCPVNEAASVLAAQKLRDVWELTEEGAASPVSAFRRTITPWLHHVVVCTIPPGGGRNVSARIVVGTRSAIAPFSIAYAPPKITTASVDSASLPSLITTKPPTGATWSPPLGTLGTRRAELVSDAAGLRPSIGRFLLHLTGESFTASPTVRLGGQVCNVVYGVPEVGRPGDLGYVLTQAPSADPAFVTALEEEWQSYRDFAARNGLPDPLEGARWFVSHDSITCVVPRGVGSGVQVVVSAQGQDTVFADFSYDRPEIQSSAPGWVQVAIGSGEGNVGSGQPRVVLSGSGLGDDIYPLTSSALPPIYAAAAAAAAEAGQTRAEDVLIVNVSYALWKSATTPGVLQNRIDDLPPSTSAELSALSRSLTSWDAACSSLLIRTPNSILQCDVAENSITPGIGVLRVHVADQPSQIVGAVFLCPPGTFATTPGILGSTCSSCPLGASCPGGFLDPVAKPSFFKISRTLFGECKPANACPGGSATFDFQKMAIGHKIDLFAASSSSPTTPSSAESTRRLEAGGKKARRLQTAEASRDPQRVKQLLGDSLDGLGIDLDSVSELDAERVAETREAWRKVEAGISVLYSSESTVGEQWQLAYEANMASSVSQCSSAYTGERCAGCADRHYRLEAECLPCPDLAWLYMVLFFVAIVAVLGFGWYLHRRQVNLTGLSVGVDFLQIVSQFAAYGFEWPVEMRWVFAVTSSANLNLQILAPECTITFTYEQRFFAMALLPVVLFVSSLIGLGVFLLVGFIRKQIRSWQKRREEAQYQAMRRAMARNDSTGMSILAQVEDEDDDRIVDDEDEDEDRNSPRPLDIVLGVLFTLLYYLYLQVVRNSLGVFDCTPTVNEDGTEGARTMDAEPSIICDTEVDDIYRSIFPWAVVTLTLYGFGIPVLFAAVLYLNRHSIKIDQQLRARGEGSTYVTNPAFRVRRRFGKLYEDYRPEMTHWRLVLILRKFALVYTTTIFGRYALFQGSVSVLILFIAYVLHTKYQPFLSSVPVPKAFLDLANDPKKEEKGAKKGRGRAPSSSVGSEFDDEDTIKTLLRTKSGKYAAKRGSITEARQLPLWLRILQTISPVAVLACSSQGRDHRNACGCNCNSWTEFVTSIRGLPGRIGSSCGCCGSSDAPPFPTDGKKRRRRRRSLADDREEFRRLAEVAKNSSVSFVFEYNSLESSFLTSALLILLGGMVFSSSALERGTAGYTILLVVLSVIIVSATLSFIYMLGFELYRSLRFASIYAKAREYEERARRETVDLQRNMLKIDKLFRGRVDMGRTMSYRGKDDSDDEDGKPTGAKSKGGRAQSGRTWSLRSLGDVFSLHRKSLDTNTQPSPSSSTSTPFPSSPKHGPERIPAPALGMGPRTASRRMSTMVRASSSSPRSIAAIPSFFGKSTTTIAGGDSGGGGGEGGGGGGGIISHSNPMRGQRVYAQNPLMRTPSARLRFASEAMEGLAKSSSAGDSGAGTGTGGGGEESKEEGSSEAWKRRSRLGSEPEEVVASPLAVTTKSSKDILLRESRGGSGGKPPPKADARAEAYLLRRSARKAVFRFGLNNLPPSRALPLTRSKTKERARQVASAAAKRLIANTSVGRKAAAEGRATAEKPSLASTTLQLVKASKRAKAKLAKEAAASAAADTPIPPTPEKETEEEGGGGERVVGEEEEGEENPASRRSSEDSDPKDPTVS